MPRSRLTDQQRREKALEVAIAKAKVVLDLPYDQDVALEMGLSKTTFAARKKSPYRGYGFDRASQLARALHFTGREVCEIMGVPYGDPEEETQ